MELTTADLPDQTYYKQIAKIGPHRLWAFFTLSTRPHTTCYVKFLVDHAMHFNTPIFETWSLDAAIKRFNKEVMNDGNSL